MFVFLLELFFSVQSTHLSYLETDIRFTHKSLVESSKAGDRNSQYKLYDIYVDAMYNIGLRFLGIKEDAEDIVQESFVYAFKNLFLKSLK